MRLGVLVGGFVLALIALPAAAEKVTLTPAERQAVIAAYHKLVAPEPESRKLDELPPGEAVERIDVSTPVRSRSFGHKTWLLVPAGARQFYVQYGKSTNAPPALYGPFPVTK